MLEILAIPGRWTTSAENEAPAGQPPASGNPPERPTAEPPGNLQTDKPSGDVKTEVRAQARVAKVGLVRHAYTPGVEVVSMAAKQPPTRTNCSRRPSCQNRNPKKNTSDRMGMVSGLRRMSYLRRPRPQILRRNSACGRACSYIACAISDGLYAEAGAMRDTESPRPDSRILLLKSSVCPPSRSLMGFPTPGYFVHGKRYRDQGSDASPTYAGFVPEHERDKTINQGMWADASRALVQSWSSGR